ncbi:MAG: phytanoyl-CoA dioxygenase family protein [Planctomycetota bacterium]
MNLTTNTRRLFNRVRRGVDNLPTVERRSRSRFLAARRRHRAANASAQAHVPAELRHDGFCLTSLKALGLPEVAAYRDSLDRLATDLAAQPIPKSDAVFTVWADDAAILKHPEVFRLGLHPPVLDLVESYLGFSPAYHGAYVRRDFARRSSSRSRLWHLDLEDHRMFKLIVYVRDVTEADGPIEVVPAAASRRIVREQGYGGGWIHQPQLQDAIEAAPRRSVTGPAGTVVLIDPSRVLHRGGPLEPGHERFTVFYDFTTARPRRPYYCKSSVTPATLDVMRRPLDDRQRRALDWRRPSKQPAVTASP